MILAEIGDIMRFDSPDKLASYAGLTPSLYQSGSVRNTGQITKQGSGWLRWILTQCTQASLKTRRSYRLKKFFNRIAKKRGKQKAIIATARKMLKTTWHLMNKNQYYENIGL